MFSLAAKTAAAAALYVGLATASHAVTWTITGPGTTGQSTLDDVTTLTYAINPAGFSTRTWDVTAVAENTGDAVFDWDFSGFHSYYFVTAGLQTINPSATLVSDGPANCCSAPSGGFSYEGRTTFNVTAGDVFGFRITGSNFDSNNVLRGQLEIAPVPLPATAGLALLGLAGLGMTSRRKSAAESA